MSAAGRIHAATLASPRLRAVLKLLADGKPHTTREIVRKANVMAVSACAAELREHGAVIECVRQISPSGIGTCFYYTMTKGPSAK